MLHSRARSSVPQPMASPSLAVSPAALGLPPVLEWQAQEVASFLASLKCGHLAPVFEQNDITGDVILELDMSHLKEMGVTRVGDRVRLQVGLKALRSSTFAAAASTPVTPRHSVGMRGSPSVTGIHAGVEGAVARGPSPRLEDQAGPTELLRTTASHIRQASSNDSRSRTSSGSSGHRPAPLDIAGTFARDPRLPQVYQPGARPIVPRSASSSSILPLAAATISQPAYVPRPIGSLPDISAPTLAHRPSRDTSLRQAGSTPSGSTLRPPGNHPQQPPEILLPSEPPLGAPSGHLKAAELSTGSAGGSFTERRALRALERENRSGRPSTAPGASGSASAPRLVPSSMAGPSAPSSSASVTLGVNGRPAPLAALSSHPFATTPATPSSPSYPPLSSAHPPSDTLSSSTDSLTLSAPSSSTLAPSRSNSSLRSTGGTTPSLEDLKYKIVKFINPEDGNTRVVDVTDCSGGWEVLEKVLRKFGKWREGGSGARSLGVADDSDDEEGRGVVVLDGWGVYLEGYGGEGIGHPLTESELLSVCHAPVDSPARNRGLTLKRVKKLGNRKQVEKFFGEAPPQPASPTSPTYFAGAATPRDSVAAGKGGLSAGAKKMNRASTISVMAGLGVDGLKQAQQPPPPMPLSPAVASSSPAPTPAATTTATSATRSPSSGSFLISKGRKMYNFFGHRPPSELISTHLTEYFPKVQKKVLERTARNSMMRITSGDGGVRGSWATAGGEGSARLSTSSFGDSIASPRKKRISQGAHSIASSNLSGGAKHHPLHRTSTSPPRSAIPEDASPDDPVGLPRVSISTDGVSESESEAGSVDSRPPLLPPVDTSADSWSDSLSIYSPNFIAAGDALRRNSIASARPMSLLSQFRRRKKDTSDTASFLTVDEITAHVDSKRSSQDSASAAEDGIEVIDDEDLDEDDDDVRTPAPPGRRFSRGSRRLDRVMSYYESSHGSGEDEDEGAYSDEAEDEDDDDEDEDSDDDEADEAADEQGKAFLSEGGKRSFKWIKGALIGSGSFGSVFLGMDASRGLLMAVKQVDIPTGVSANEERKKEMLNALEREIELLKELQHDNIVQYLDSSIDASHLNIFLEYVPGGSVTALLSNYGAFEEALVRVFIRQTLQGLAYLHDKGIIHRDIKGANILVDNKGGIKISDFGISKKVESDLLDNSNNRKSLQGTVFWMAPEVVKQTAHTTKADIWSVGCLVVEMLTGQRPWGRLDQMQVMFKIGSLSRPELPPDITSEAEDFLEKTFMLDFHARPTAIDLLAHDFIQADLDPAGDA